MMQKNILWILVLALSSAYAGVPCGPRIGDKAPAFTGESSEGTINFPSIAKKNGRCFLAIQLIQLVCPTESKRLAGMTQEFKKLNTQLIGLSEDPEYVHEAWVRKLNKEIQKEGKTKRTVQFPVVADPSGKIARNYGMIHPNESKTQTVRAVFIIDPNDTVRFIAFYPISNGREFNRNIADTGSIARNGCKKCGNTH